MAITQECSECIEQVQKATHPTKQQLYGYQPSITKTIQVKMNQTLLEK